MPVLSHQVIEEETVRLGFCKCGVAPAEPVCREYAEHYRNWLGEGRNGEMRYLENHFEKRMDPRLLVPDVRSVISVAMNYFPDKVASGIAWYAQGKDYHDVMRERLSQLMSVLGAHGRCFVDTAPVPERYWAWRCGLGWIGKHSQLVVPQMGSTFFLGELFVEEEMDSYDAPMPNRCGNCTRCLDACPTGALKIEDGKTSTFNSQKCLSYLTIEHRGELPEWAGGKMGDMFYGCDRCLRACPHLHASPTNEPDLQPSEALLSMRPSDWQQLTLEQYRTLFKGSAVKRAKYEGLMRNIQAVFPSSES